MWNTVVQYFKEIPNDNRPNINVEVEGCAATALIDSGSQVNLMNVTLWEQIKEENDKIQLQGVTTILRAANGSPIHVLGERKFMTGIRGISKGISFIVVTGLKCQCLLGANGMETMGMTLDMKNKKVHVEDDLCIRNCKKIVLEPCSEGLHEFEISHRGCDSAEVLVEERILDNQVVHQESLYCAQSDKVNILLSNPTNDKVVFEKYTTYLPADRKQKETTMICEEKLISSTVSDQKLRRGRRYTEQDVDLSRIPGEWKKPYLELVNEFSDVFTNDPYDIGKCPIVPHHIELLDKNKISNVPPYRIPHELKPVVNEYVDKLLKADVIRKSTSPFSSPVLLVKKPNWRDTSLPASMRYRVVNDYRKLNTNLKKDAFPLQNIQDLLDEASQGSIFNLLDISSGFYHQMLTESSKPYTAFSIAHLGHFEFNRSPMGITSSPAAYSRLMHAILQGLPQVFLYLDDCLTVSRTHHEAIDKLRQVLTRFRAYNLKCKLSKVQLGADNINYLGYNISKQHGIRPGEAKVKAIKNWPIPRSRKEIKSFVGLCSFFRRTVKDFALIISPLTKLLRKDSGYDGGELPPPAEKAFELMKQILISRPCLKPVDFRKPFILTVDSCKTGVGAILSQIGDNGIEHPVCYASKTNSKQEQNRPGYLLESYGLLWAVRLFACYLLGGKN